MLPDAHQKVFNEVLSEEHDARSSSRCCVHSLWSAFGGSRRVPTIAPGCLAGGMHHVNHTRVRNPEMKNTTATNAAAAGTIALGEDSTVNRMGFGAMRLTGPGIWGEPADPEECRRVLRRAVEVGVTFIDTADSYGPEVSERLIAEALHPYPQGLVIGTKGGQVRPGPGRWTPVGRPRAPASGPGRQPAPAQVGGD